MALRITSNATAPSTRPRNAALDDKIRDHSVELHAVVEVAVGELLEIRHRRRRVLVVQLRDNGAAVGLKGCSFGHVQRYTLKPSFAPGRMPRNDTPEPPCS